MVTGILAHVGVTFALLDITVSSTSARNQIRREFASLMAACYVRSRLFFVQRRFAVSAAVLGIGGRIVPPSFSEELCF